MPITRITEDPKYTKKALNEQIDDNWHGAYIARQAIGDIWYDVYLYTEFDGDELVAIGTAQLDEQGYLEILNVACKRHRSGHGQQMVGRFKALAESLDTTIKVISGAEAVGFWQAVGFEIDECYYGNEPNGVLMWQQ